MCRGYHWNVKGDPFFELHAKFEELYTDINVKIDELAERVLTLGLVPVHAYSYFIEQSDVKETRDVFDGKQAVRNILENFKLLLAKQRSIVFLAGQSHDEGTAALMSDYIREQEKLVWMYSAYLGK